MKKIGRYTVRGEIDINTYNNKIQLFDGRFDTGYKIVKVEISPRSPTENTEAIMTISSEELSSNPGAYWSWGDNRQIAWSRWGAPNAAAFGMETVIDEDNMIIEDMYLQCYLTVDTGALQYQITLEKYDLGNDWTGALSMVRNKSQG